MDLLLKLVFIMFLADLISLLGAMDDPQELIEAGSSELRRKLTQVDPGKGPSYAIPSTMNQPTSSRVLEIEARLRLDIPTILAQQDRSLGAVRPLEQGEKELETMSDEQLKSFASESKDFTATIRRNTNEVSKGLLRLEKRNPNGAEEIKPPMNTEEERTRMAAIVLDTTNSYLWAAETIEATLSRRLNTAQRTMVKARLALRGAFDAQMDLIHSGYYASFDNGYPAYRWAKLKLHRAFIKNQLILIHSTDYDTEEAKTLKTFEIIELMKQCSVTEKRLQIRVQRHSMSMERDNFKRKRLGGKNEIQGIKNLSEHLSASILLQREAIRQLLEGNLKRAHKLMTRAYLEGFQSETIHEENREKGYRDVMALDDQFYQEQSKKLEEELLDIHDHDRLDWLDDNKNQDRKIFELRSDLRTWYENHQDLKSQLKVMHQKVRTDDDHQRRSKSLSKTNNNDEKSNSLTWRETMPNVLASLKVDSMYEANLVFEAYQFLRQGEFREASVRLRNALRLQNRLAVTRLRRVKSGRSDEMIEGNPIYQEKHQRMEKIIKKLEEFGFGLSLDPIQAIRGLENRLGFLYSTIKDVNMLLGGSQRKSLSDNQSLRSLPKLMTIDLKPIPAQSQGEILKEVIQKAYIGVHQMNRAIEHLQRTEIKLASEALEEASRARLEADRARAHWAMAGLPDSLIRLDPKYQSEYLKLQESMKKFRSQ